MNTALNVVKGVGGLVISVGVGAVAANLIKVTTPGDAKKLAKICIGVGSFFVAGLASSAASDRFDDTMDKIINTVNVWTAEENSTDEEDQETEA